MTMMCVREHLLIRAAPPTPTPPHAHAHAHTCAHPLPNAPTPKYPHTSTPTPPHPHPHAHTHMRPPILPQVDVYRRLGQSLNVAHLQEAYEDDVCVDLVMELCSGGQLWKRIQRGSYSEQQAARCVV